MWGMLAHLGSALDLFLADSTKTTLVVAAIVSAVTLIWLSRNLDFSAKIRSAFMYAHVALLLFPPVFFATTLSCKQVGLCEVGLTQTLLFVIPITLILGLAFGLLIVPLLHRLRSQPESGKWQRFVNGQSDRLGLHKAPDVFIVDSGRPEAFSTGGLKPAMFISIGMLEVLTRRQIEAVLLHELGHIQEGSHALKPITWLLRALYPEPVLAPAAIVAEEERKADAFAASVQKTDVHLNRAKRKMAE
ncbi:M48 family metalloprotease [Candidatus Micrarchaeota archaeon]|nr:M48 family metalloprotease [Candidatus Micrarchaeota archaeon]